TLWPARLSPLYEYPVKLDILHWPYLLSVVVFVVICLLAWRLRAARPGVGAAWLSYLMILAPVSGLIHAGPQLVADRYTYLATMGLAVLAGGGLVHLWARLRGRTRRTCLVAAALSVAGLLGVMTRNQLHIWQNSAALWEHVHRLHPDSWHANNNLGILRAREGRTQEAETLYGHAVRVKPDYANGYHNLAVLLDSVGREDEAIANFETALQIDPAYPKAYACLGNIYLKRGDLSTAAEMYRLGQQYAPDDPVILSNLGNVLTRLGTLEQAIPLLQRAIGIAPDLLQAHYNLGLAWENAGRAEQALTEYRRCAELDPDHSPSAKSMGDLLVSLGRFHEAIEPLQRVARLNPSDVQTQTNLGYVMILASRYAAASRILAAAHQQDPNHLPTILALANLQAASPVDSVRDGPNAVRLATLACERTNHANARALDILAAAHAETKRFDLAVSAAREALQIARVAGDTRTADQIEARLRLYLASTPYRLPARAEP
ncbi:MAG: tetratricopeptide repeat protein, partial [Phycisphaerales bacterium]